MVNGLEESLNLFQAICNNKFFVKTTHILAYHSTVQLGITVMYHDTVYPCTT